MQGIEPKHCLREGFREGRRKMTEARGPTNQQEIFVQEIIKGKSQREAYRIAYPKSRSWKETAVDSTASELFKRPKVYQRYQELKEEAKERSLWNFEMAQKELIEMLLDSKEAGNFNGRYNAIKELNQLSGFYDKKKEDVEEKAKSGLQRIAEAINARRTVQS